MKNTFFLLLAASMTIASCSKSPISANDDSSSSTSLQARRGADDPPAPVPAGLPAAVVSAFNTRYPAATRVEWQAEDGNTWKAKFYIGTQRKAALFSSTGVFLWEKNI